jgi:hypothetical protein
MNFKKPKMEFTKDSYVWFSPSGELFDACNCDHEGSAIHNIWAQEYLVKYHKLDGDRIDNLMELEKIYQTTNSDYAYEHLEKLGWIRYLPWTKSNTFYVDPSFKYTKVIRVAVKDFCLENGIELPDEFKPKE